MGVSTKIGRDSGELVITVSGTFDFNSVQEFRASYDEASAFRRYIIDMATVNHIDSSALGMLLNMKKSVGESAEVAIINCKPNIKKIFVISRFDKKFSFE